MSTFRAAEVAAAAAIAVLASCAMATPPVALGSKLGSGVLFVQFIDLMRNIHAMNIHRVNLRTFDLNLLRVLDALLTEPQVSAAARRLNLSQPATSAALLRLRNALADPLLVRVGNRMALTRLAEALRPKVRRLVAEIELTLGAPPDFDPATSERALRIAANDHAVVAVVSPLLQRLRRIAPRMRMEVLPFEDDFERRLAEGNYDVAVRDRWSMRTWRSLETLFHED
jgi:LysR family nod box-dependent transcriptional activator